MSSKYHINVSEAAPRFDPIPRISAMEIEGCLGCVECVKRTACIYDVYKKRKYNPGQAIDTTDVLCVRCMRCVQECKKNILSRIRTPQYDSMGDDYWKPEIIAGLWEQSKTGKIPVSGAGYRGPFAGPGFDSMWTDMSEIVRPTRDGIHGREYISTVIELGRRPAILEFGKEADLITEMPPFAEIPLPIILDVPENHFVTGPAKQAIAAAAGTLHTFAIVPLKDALGELAGHLDHLIVRFDPGRDDPKMLKGITIIEVPYSENIAGKIKEIKTVNPHIIVSIRLPLDEYAGERAAELSADCAEIVHLQADRRGNGLGRRKDDFIIKLIKEIHFELLNKSLRDQITLLVTGGIATAEHMPKAIACGVDGVGLDLVPLVALECRLCPECDRMRNCPVKIDTMSAEYGAQRIVNLMGAWHSQLIEVMGAMGLREVRRLRGELGRVMFFKDLEHDNLGPVFGNRIHSLKESLVSRKMKNESHNLKINFPEFPATRGRVVKTASHYRNSMSLYKVVRTSACISCGKCAEVCEFGVHKKAGNRMLAPKSQYCQGPEICKSNNKFCETGCPVNAIRVGKDPLWKSFGDPRWPSELLAGTWKQAETGYPPENGLEYKKGKSGGGFDRINISFPKDADNAGFKPLDSFFTDAKKACRNLCYYIIIIFLKFFRIAPLTGAGKGIECSISPCSCYHSIKANRSVAHASAIEWNPNCYIGSVVVNSPVKRNA